MTELTIAQRRALDVIRREGAPVHSRRLAGELDCRSQDAGRTLEALRRRGLLELVTVPRFGYQEPRTPRPSRRSAEASSGS